MSRTTEKVVRPGVTRSRAAPGLLVVLGLLIVTGWWDAVMMWLRSWLATTGLGSSVL